MNIDDVETFLSRLGCDTKRKTMNGVWYTVPCPFAPFYHAKGSDRNPSFGVAVKADGPSYYKCLSCGQKGRVPLLAAKIGRLRKQDLSELVKWGELAELNVAAAAPLPDWDEMDEPASKIVNSIEVAKEKKNQYPLAWGVPYLAERGVYWRDIIRLDLRVDRYQRRVLFPVFDRQCRFAGYTGRSYRPSKTYSKSNPKVRDYFGLRKERLFLYHPEYYRRQSQSPLIVTEGLFDYVRVYQAGYLGAHAALGTALTDAKIDWLISLNRPVFLFFDHDRAGDTAMFGQLDPIHGKRTETNLAWAERLYGSVPVWICEYPPSAITSDKIDPGSLTVKQVRWAINNAWMYNGLYSLPEYDLNSEIPF